MLTTVLLLSAVSAPLSAQEKNTISKEEMLVIEEKLKLEGVPEEQQKALMNKLEKGELWDSVNPEKQSLIPEGYFKLSLKENGEKTFVFPDGSFKTVAVEVSTSQPTSEIQPQIIQAKTVKFTATNIFSTARIEADVMLTDFSESRFTNIHRPHNISGLGASISDISDEYVRQIQNSSGPAHFRVYYRVNVAIPPFISTLMRVDCYVEDFTTWVDLVDL